MAVYYFSASTGGFYVDEIHRSMPPDVVQIAEEEWRALLQAQTTGLRIVADANGRPTTAAQPPIEQAAS